MAKWADYAISAVRFNGAHTHIDRVRVHPDNGDSIGNGSEQVRSAMLSFDQERHVLCHYLQERSG